jgi:hypothetical protein
VCQRAGFVISKEQTNGKNFTKKQIDEIFAMHVPEVQ